MASVTEAAAKVAGKAKGAAEALAGYPGVFHHLAAEHAEVSTLMKRVASSSQDSDVRDEIFPEIRKSLLAHAHAEEKEFYPPLKSFDRLEGLIEQSLKEHKQVEDYIQELDTSNKNTKKWTGLFERLVQAVEQHVESEENELFPQAAELISAEQAREIGERYEAEEQREKSRL